ncbi:hypothetical protein [Azospirillum argentinense]
MTRTIAIITTTIATFWLQEGRLQAAEVFNAETCEPQPVCRLSFSTKAPGAPGIGIMGRGLRLDDQPSIGIPKPGNNALEPASPTVGDMLKNAKPDTFRLPGIESVPRQMPMRTQP